MSNRETINFGKQLLSMLVAIIAMLFVAASSQAIDPIFDDDDEIAASATDKLPADAARPTNVEPLVAFQAPMIPDAPALPEEPAINAPPVTEKPAASEIASAAAPENLAPVVTASKETKTPPATPAAGDKPAVANAQPAEKPAENKPPEPVTLEPEKVGVAAATVAKAEKAKENLGQRRAEDVGRNEELSFLQSKVTAQMLELEERMYRLSDALKNLEPENASRLLIGLKYAREELIQLQMKEIQSALTSQNFRDAVVEQKQVLAKLQRLEQLLLSPDLDFQLQLERLRLMRELLKRLDAAIKEEEREKADTEQTLAREKQLQALRERKATLKEIIARQTGHVKAGGTLAAPADSQKTDNEQNRAELPAADAASRIAAIEALATEQQTTRELTEPLEKTAEPIADAGKQMGQALDQLKLSLPDMALPHQAAALESLKRALQGVETEEKKLEVALADEKFAAMRKDQANTRKRTDGISETAVQLGEAGAAARGELIRAGGSMSNAEQSFGGRNASGADMSQGEALASLKYARELLEAEAEKLLNRLRSEIKKRTIEGIAQMLEGQIVIRESTQRLGPKAKDKARAVLTAIVGLATAESKLITIGEGLTSLVEETEFGIALPAALRSVTDAMTEVKERLASVDASEEVVAAEILIEEDLQQLLDAMKQLPSQNDGRGGGGGGAGRRERQLNRLIAELKMVRMLQVRVNRDTTDVNQKRPAEIKELTATIKRRIEAVHDRQEDVHDVTEKISIERSDELQQ